MNSFSPRASEDEWDVANAAFERGEELPDAPPGASPCVVDPIVYRECFCALLQKFDVDSIPKDEDTGAWYLFCCLRRSRAFVESRAELLFLSRSELDYSNAVHCRMLFHIYFLMMDVPPGRGSQLPIRGQHWESIGFQGENPATDLRSTGVLGLLHLLYLIERAPSLFADLRALWMRGSHSFPFVLVGFNFSALAMDVLRTGSFELAVRRLEKTKGGVVSPVCEAINLVYIGLWKMFCNIWTDAPERCVADFGLVKLRIKKTLGKGAFETFRNGQRIVAEPISSPSQVVSHQEGGFSSF